MLSHGPPIAGAIPPCTPSCTDHCVVHSQLAVGTADGVCRVWAIDDELEPSIDPVSILEGHTGVVSAVCWAAGGRRVVTGSWDKGIKLWDVAAQLCADTQQAHKLAVRCVALGGLAGAEADEWVASGGRDGEILLWRQEISATGVVLRASGCLTGHKGGVNAICWTNCYSDCRWLVSAGDDQQVLASPLHSSQPTAQ